MDFQATEADLQGGKRAAQNERQGKKKNISPSDPSLKLTDFTPFKIDGWKMKPFLLEAYVQGFLLLVLGSVGVSFRSDDVPELRWLFVYYLLPFRLLGHTRRRLFVRNRLVGCWFIKASWV